MLPRQNTNNKPIPDCQDKDTHLIWVRDCWRHIWASTELDTFLHGMTTVDLSLMFYSWIMSWRAIMAIMERRNKCHHTFDIWILYWDRLEKVQTYPWIYLNFKFVSHTICYVNTVLIDIDISASVLRSYIAGLEELRDSSRWYTVRLRRARVHLMFMNILFLDWKWKSNNYYTNNYTSHKHQAQNSVTVRLM